MDTAPLARYTRPSPSNRGNGILLLVILITLAIALYLMFGNMGGTSYMQQVQQTKKKGREMVNEISTQQMSLLIAMYRQNNSKLPKEPADLDSPGAFNDQWGKEMRFTFEEKKGQGTIVTYISAGPDGEFGTEDDVKRTDVLPPL